MARFDHFYNARMDTLRARGAERGLLSVRPAGPGRVWREGRELIDVSSNDYLGLSRDPILARRAQAAIAAWGVGATASRLVCGTLELHAAIEAKIARFKGAEAALVFASGFQANASVIPALLDESALGRAPLVFADAMIHASMHHGLRAAGIRPVFFRHNDLDELGSLLERHAGGARFILTESVFSMDGDRVDVVRLAEIARRHDAFLYLDEAHATGVQGPQGRGLAALVPGGVDLAMGTFSKAMGGFGAYVACSEGLRHYLINRCAGFVYSTAPPPAVLGAIDAALDLVPDMTEARRHLHALGHRLRTGLKDAGLDTGPSTTQIVPLIIGDECATLAVSRALAADGFLAVAIRPPTVPAGTSRIRFALSAAHTVDDVDRLLDSAIAAVGRRALTPSAV